MPLATDWPGLVSCRDSNWVLIGDLSAPISTTGSRNSRCVRGKAWQSSLPVGVASADPNNGHKMGALNVNPKTDPCWGTHVEWVTPVFLTPTAEMRFKCQ